MDTHFIPYGGMVLRTQSLSRFIHWMASHPNPSPLHQTDRISRGVTRGRPWRGRGRSRGRGRGGYSAPVAGPSHVQETYNAVGSVQSPHPGNPRPQATKPCLTHCECSTVLFVFFDAYLAIVLALPLVCQYAAGSTMSCSS